MINYTTSIAAEKTAGEIQTMLAKAKAQAVLCEYGPDAIMAAMSFRIATKYGVVSFRLPANIDGVLNAMKADRRIPKSKQTRQQATNVAWRVLKDWVQAQLAIVEADMAEMTQVFLPYAQDATGRTMYEAVAQAEFKMLALK